MTDRYAVMGNPIAHSKSPALHHLFAEQTAQDLTYEAILVQPGDFAAAARRFAAAGGRGLNVTVPFKTDAWCLADTLSARSERAGAVNTLVFQKDGSIHGHTTDGLGLLRDLTSHLGVAVRSRRVLILGAGGAVRGLLQPLLLEGPQSVLIANRNRERAIELAVRFSDLGTVRGAGLDDLDGLRFDLVLQATPAGLDGQPLPALPPTLFADGAVAYDLVYADQPTPFLRWAHAQGVQRLYDGLGMLIEQAAESFWLWRGVRPDTRPVRLAMRPVPLAF